MVPPLTTTAEDAPAVRLFVERARAVAPDLTLGRAELDEITEITRRLDGRSAPPFYWPGHCPHVAARVGARDLVAERQR